MRKFSRIAIQIPSAVNLSGCTRNQQAVGVTSKCFTTSINKGAATTPALFNSTQQTRKYVPSRLTTCWNCNRVTVEKNRMICDNCGRLQDVDTELVCFD